MKLRAMLARGSAAGALSLASPVVAEPIEPDSGVQRGPVLPAHLVPRESSHWVVSAGLERFGSGFAGSDDLFALASTFRVRAFGPYALLMAKPNTGPSRYEESRFLLGLGLRAYVPVLGTELSYGVGVMGELRFEDHFWLLYGTPLELSAVVYRRGTFEVELFAGLRRPMAGELINSFLLDPNGFQNEEAAAELYRAKHDDGFRPFVRLVISRRVD